MPIITTDIAAAAAVLSAQQADGAVAWRQAPADAGQYAHTLYRHLRELDAAAAEVLIAAKPPQTPQWAAINDRPQRAAAAPGGGE